MDLNNFAEPQRQALLDLATLAMYSDGHLAAAEDERVLKLLTSMGLATESDRNKSYDASISRVRGHLATETGARAHASELAKSFSSSDQRHQVSEFFATLRPATTRFLHKNPASLPLLKRHCDSSRMMDKRRAPRFIGSAAAFSLGIPMLVSLVVLGCHTESSRKPDDSAGEHSAIQIQSADNLLATNSVVGATARSHSPYDWLAGFIPRSYVYTTNRSIEEAVPAPPPQSTFREQKQMETYRYEWNSYLRGNRMTSPSFGASPIEELLEIRR